VKKGRTYDDKTRFKVWEKKTLLKILGKLLELQGWLAEVFINYYIVANII
jgi:hypothetical protein